MNRKKDRRDWQHEDYFWERVKGNLIAGAVISAVVLLVLKGKEVWEWVSDFFLP